MMDAVPAVGSPSIPRPADSTGTRTARRPRFRVEVFPAGRIVSIDTDELDEFKQRSTGWSVQYHALDATRRRSTVSLVATASLQVGLVQHDMGYSSQGENPPGTLSIVAPVDDGRPMVHRGHGIGPLQAALIRSGEGYECVGRSGARFVIASVAQETLERHAADLWHEAAGWRHAPDRLQFPDSEHRSRYLHACRRILGIVHEQPGVLGDQRVATLLEEKVLEALLLNANEVPSAAQGRNRYRLARQTYRYLLDRPGEIPSIRKICAATRASYATLERAFRKTYGMTPKALMTAMRLSGARRALLHPDPTTTVTAVALDWGFLELGRFSVQYHQRYGEVPSETLHRARGRPAADRT